MDEYGAEPRPSILKAVAIGGVITGVCTLVPGVASFNCVCCLWFAVGAIVAVLIYKTSLLEDLTAGTGALLGLCSGLIGGFIACVAQAVLYFPQLTPEKFPVFKEKLIADFDKGMMKGPGMDESFMTETMNMIESLTPEMASTLVIVSLVVLIVLGTCVAVIAGMITAAIAGKQNRPMDEPPPYQPPG